MQSTFYFVLEPFTPRNLEYVTQLSISHSIYHSTYWVGYRTYQYTTQLFKQYQNFGEQTKESQTKQSQTKKSEENRQNSPAQSARYTDQKESAALKSENQNHRGVVVSALGE